VEVQGIAMRQLFLDKSFVAVKEVCESGLDANSVLVSISHSFVNSRTEIDSALHEQKHLGFENVSEKVQKVLASVSGTNISNNGRLNEHQVRSLGYSCSGTVVAVGRNVQRFRPGDLVACSGSANVQHAGMIVVSKNLVARVSDSKYLSAASLTTVGTVAMQGLRRAGVQLGERVCVFGLGIVGQITARLAKLSGCKVIGIDRVKERLERAQKFGIDVVLASQDSDLETEIAYKTQYRGVDCTIITATSKSSSIINQTINFTRKNGRVVLVGDVGLQLEQETLDHKQVDILVSYAHGPGRHDVSYEHGGIDYPYNHVRWTENRNMQAFVSLIEDGTISVSDFIDKTVQYPDDNGVKGLLEDKTHLGIVLNYEAIKTNRLTRPLKKTGSIRPARITFMPKNRINIRVGVIGAGAFASKTLLPILSSLNYASVNAVSDINVSAAKSIAKKYNLKHIVNNDQELFSQDAVDAVVISSPHAYHCDQALNALRNGKAVMLEKPMVTSIEQLERLKGFLRKNPEVPFCVDYARSFSPFIKKIRKVTDFRSSPLMISYRVNAGMISPEHWMQTDLGAGRIIGEVCQYVDLFCELTQATPVALSVEAIRPDGNHLFPTDNFSAQITFSDGSVCSLMYTAVGHKDLPAERMEVHFDSKSIILDDFQHIEWYGFSSWFNQSTSDRQVGHEQLFGQFFDSLKEKQFVAPISWQRLEIVAQTTLIIDKLACLGGGTQEL
jgi:predicted dehydrogenase